MAISATFPAELEIVASFANKASRDDCPCRDKNFLQFRQNFEMEKRQEAICEM
jgi:hypothetical protein